MSDLAQTMMATIDRGARLESADEMTGEYRENLVHLLTMQADSELAGVASRPSLPSSQGSWPTASSSAVEAVARTARSR